MLASWRIRENLSWVLIAGCCSSCPALASEQSQFFKAEVRPLLAQHCQKCHGPNKQEGGLRLDSREASLAGGDSGPAIVPGDPASSLVIQAMRQTHEHLSMPPKEKLSDAHIALLEKWVLETSE